MYYMLTGQPPFMSDNPLKVMIAHASQEVVPPRQINPEIPVELEEIILRCLEKDPDHRFQDVARPATRDARARRSTTPGPATGPPSGGAATAAQSAKKWPPNWSKRRPSKGPFTSRRLAAELARRVRSSFRSQSAARPSSPAAE